jgi:hypothetical protein
MTEVDTKKHIENLMEKAAKAEKSEDAMRFSQAALNAANARNLLAYNYR